MVRRNKFYNKTCVIDGHKFDSLKEGRRYQELKLMQHADLIAGLTLQPSYELAVNGQHICKYIADFSYIEKDELIIEDVKGFRTPAFNLKCKLMKACFDIDIKIT